MIFKAYLMSVLPHEVRSRMNTRNPPEKGTERIVFVTAENNLHETIIYSTGEPSTYGVLPQLVGRPTQLMSASGVVPTPLSEALTNKSVTRVCEPLLVLPDDPEQDQYAYSVVYVDLVTDGDGNTRAYGTVIDLGDLTDDDPGRMDNLFFRLCGRWNRRVAGLTGEQYPTLPRDKTLAIYGDTGDGEVDLLWYPVPGSEVYVRDGIQFRSLEDYLADGGYEDD